MSLRADAVTVFRSLSESTVPLILSQFRSRSLDRPPARRLRISITIPAQNEEELIGDCLRGLKAQVDRWGDPLDPDLFEVILVINNSTDRSVEIAHRFASLNPDFRLHIIDVVLAPRHAHVGWARRLAMEEALGRFRYMRRPGGVIAATDADTVVAPDWVAQTLAEIEAGAEGVGGKLLLPPVSLLDAEPRLRETTQMAARFRHSNRVRVFTSDRQDGRAAGGMAATPASWRSHLASGKEVLVECPDAVVGRLTAKLPGPENKVPLDEALPALSRRVMESR